MKISSRNENGNLAAMPSNPKPKRKPTRLWSECLRLWKDRFQEAKQRKWRKWKEWNRRMFTNQLQSERNRRWSLLTNLVQSIYLETIGSLHPTRLKTFIAIQEWALNTMKNQPPIIWATKVWGRALTAQKAQNHEGRKAGCNLSSRLWPIHWNMEVATSLAKEPLRKTSPLLDLINCPKGIACNT